MAQIQKENLLPLYAGDTAGYVRIVGADGISYRYSIQALIDLAAEDHAIAGKIGDLDELTTEQKASLVAAINELNGELILIETADATDIGKALSPKTVEDGIVTEWQYKTIGGGGGGGTSDYTDLDNKPQINGVTLTGNKTAADLGITVPQAATATPASLGTAAVGSSSKYAKEDHVHAMPTASDVGALPSNTTYVSSVNGSSGAVTIGNATTSASGLMSATDKGRLDDLYADYSSALTALGVI